MGRTRAEALMIDHELGKAYAQAYIVGIQNQITARGLILTGAMQDFNSFLNLPASSSLAAAIWDVAFGALSSLVPLLKLGDFITKAKNNADIALFAAQTFGMKARAVDRVKHAAARGAEVSAEVARYVDAMKGTVEKGLKVHDVVKGADKIDGHASWKPIVDLIQELQAAQKLWETAVKTELTEWINRVDDLPPTGPHSKKSLEALIKELLPPLPVMFTEDELAQIRLLYLYLMVVEHCRKNVYWQEKMVRGTFAVEGLNDQQMTQLVLWFSPGKAAGKYFKKPPIIHLGHFLSSIPVRVEKSLDVDFGGDNAKSGNRV